MLQECHGTEWVGKPVIGSALHVVVSDTSSSLREPTSLPCRGMHVWRCGACCCIFNCRCTRMAATYLTGTGQSQLGSFSSPDGRGAQQNCVLPTRSASSLLSNCISSIPDGSLVKAHFAECFNAASCNGPATEIPTFLFSSLGLYRCPNSCSARCHTDQSENHTLDRCTDGAACRHPANQRVRSSTCHYDSVHHGLAMHGNLLLTICYCQSATANLVQLMAVQGVQWQHLHAQPVAAFLCCLRASNTIWGYFCIPFAGSIWSGSIVSRTRH